MSEELEFEFDVEKNASLKKERGISFEEPDAWFHMRTIHNLLAHFPRRSGFDPFARYPGGAHVTTGPFLGLLR